MKGWTHLLAAGVVTHKPCRLLGIIVTPAGNTSAVTIYDGENTTAPIICKVIVKDTLTFPLTFPGGVQTDRGLFLGSFDDMYGVLVLWEVD
ncbi:unnamed protein product [marine sediment metagenome]|uniref:Uncharacterized protein n=1 Tax=marine sediment metagenome TaxID=412755 RepID=X1QDM4_9ZZZZ